MIWSLFEVGEVARFGKAVTVAVVDDAGVGEGSEVEDSIKSMANQ